jgi:hypothetical protein
MGPLVPIGYKAWMGGSESGYDCEEKNSLPSPCQHRTLFIQYVVYSLHLLSYPGSLGSVHVCLTEHSVCLSSIFCHVQMICTSLWEWSVPRFLTHCEIIKIPVLYSTYVENWPTCRFQFYHHNNDYYPVDHFFIKICFHDCISVGVKKIVNFFVNSEPQHTARINKRSQWLQVSHVHIEYCLL